MTYLNPINWARWFGGFVAAWVLSIPWLRVSHALPALLLTVALASGGVIAISEGTAWRDGLLDTQLEAAWDRDDFDTAELIVRRQLAANPEDLQNLFNLALTMSAKDEEVAAGKLMRQLVEVKGHEPAARWLLGKEYFGKKWASLTSEQRDEFGMLLEVVHRADGSDVTIKNMYADYLIASRSFGKAVPVLSSLARTHPMRGLQAAAICRTLGRGADADQLAKQCLEEVSTMSREDPSNSGLALSVAQNQLFLKQFADGVRTLDRAIPLAKSDKDRKLLQQAMGDSIVAWINYIEQSPVNSTRDKLRVLKMLETALKYAPSNPRVMGLVADHVLSTANDDSEEIATVRQALIEGSSPGVSHFIRGTAALVSDNIEDATMHLKLAADLMPNSSAILNNLAVALTSRGEDNLEASLKLAEAAIKHSPRQIPHYYETRGQILLRLKRYLQAIPDLERALAHPDLAPKAHESLATCYGELGKPDLSEQHRNAALRKSKGEEKDGTEGAPADGTGGRPAASESASTPSTNDSSDKLAKTP